MKAAIMQPYFFPYVGYFQLMAAVDVFVFLDDVQYIDRGWVNRNRILLQNRVAWLTLPVSKASSRLSINQRHYVLGETVEATKRRLSVAYAGTPFWGELQPTLWRTLECGHGSVSAFNAHHLMQLARLLGIRAQFVNASEVDPRRAQSGQSRIIRLCKLIGAKSYTNPIGGTTLYQASAFQEQDIELSFLRTMVTPESTEGGPAHLSIVHSLANRGPRVTAASLSDFERITAPSDA